MGNLLMNAYDVLVIAPAGPDREALQERLRALGHVVAGADLDEGRDLAAADLYEVVVVDARAPGVDAAWLEALGAAEAQPLLVLADRPAPVLRALGSRRGGVMVLTGAERPSGWQVALSVCAALRRTRQAQAGPLVA
jgi:DNA-binding response OmpR family regulator